MAASGVRATEIGDVAGYQVLAPAHPGRPAVEPAQQRTAVPYT